MPFAFRSPRIRNLAGFATLLAFLVAQALPWPAASPGRAPGAVQAAAIGAPRASETCPHHPQGCPPDCHCPKLHQDPGEEDIGTVSGPTLVRCTAQGAALTPAAPGPFLPLDPIAILFPERIQPLPASADQATAHGFRPSPGKIPIA